jgi:hypothetical protein
MELNEQKSLQIIEDMIQKAKKQYSDDGFLLMLWGWLVFISALGHYLLLMINYQYPFITWGLMPVGGIISAIYGMKEKQKPYRTYTDTIMSYTWSAFGISLFIVLIMMEKLQINCYPIVLLLYGIPTFISGGVLKHKPLIFGAVSCWTLSLISFFQPFDIQLLLLAAGILLAYIIPGHLLRNQYLKIQHN